MNLEDMQMAGQEPQAISPEYQEPVLSAQAMLEMTNIAEELDEDELKKIGNECKQGYDDDWNSRSDWEDETAEWVELANQVREDKTFPWPDASNIKYPLVLTAAMQFNARAYPALVPNDGKIVKAKVFGLDPTSQKAARASRVEKLMSYQVMEDMPNWEDEMDQLLMILPVTGMAFKKTYYDSFLKKNCSRLVLVENFVVNYWAKSLEEAERTSEIITISDRELKARQRAGVYLDIELGQPDTSKEKSGIWTLIEQHTYIDIDDDGYKEPVTVLFEQRSGKILRITARFDSESIQLNEKKKIVYIKPIQYYTKYGFIKAVDGSFYDRGFGHLLGPINDSVNTLVNQLTDAGTLNNLQSGFIGKGIKLKLGNSAFSPGEWKVASSTADDLRKQIVPLPTKEPSPVLFQLLGMLIQSGKELASVAEIFTGKMPGQNTPATTTMATVEQGMKLFTAIYKRVYRSLKEEFKHLYRLNYLYFPKEAVAVLDEPVSQADFNTRDYDVCPSADPTVSSQSERLIKAQGLLELLPTGLLDPVKVVSRVLEAQEQPNWQELIPGMKETGQAQVPEQPDPVMMEMQMKQAAENQKAELKAQEIARKGQMEQASKEAQMAMERDSKMLDLAHRDRMNQLEYQSAKDKQDIFVQQQMTKVAAQKEQAKIKNQQSKKDK